LPVIANLCQGSRFGPGVLARDSRRGWTAYYEEIAGVLHGLLERLDDPLPGKGVTMIAEFIEPYRPAQGDDAHKPSAVVGIAAKADVVVR
jgi:hypothetical protein